MSILKKDMFIKILAFIIPAIAIICQGSYFPLQYISVMLGLLFVLILHSVNHNILIDRNITILSFVLAALCFVPIITQDADLLNAALESIRWISLGVVIVLCDNYLKDKMLQGIYAGITIVSFLGIMAYLRLLTFNDWAVNIDGVFRMQSTIGYANMTAVYCGIGVILSYIFIEKFEKFKRLHTYCLIINLFGMILTFSRFGIAFFVISLLITLSIKYRYMLLACVVGFIVTAAGVGYMFISGNERLLLGSTLVSRLIYWQDGFMLFLKYPLGIGAGKWENWQYLIQTSGYNVKFVHNGLLQIAIDNGIMALIACILFLLMGILSIFVKWRNTKDNLYLGLMAACFLIVMHSFVDMDLSFSATLVTLGIIFAFGINRSYVVEKIPVIIVCTMLIFSLAGVLFYSSIQRSNDNDYEALIAEYVARPNNVLVVSKLFNITYLQSNIEDMYKWSKEWIALAPRQQNAYDAYLVSLDRMIEETSEDTYREEKNMLYKKADEINKTTNPLCKYYDSYTNIILPKFK